MSSPPSSLTGVTAAFAQLLQEASAPAPSPPSAPVLSASDGEESKFSGTGGVSFKLNKPVRSGVVLCELGSLGSSFCGGAVGQSGKVCLATDCSIAAHRSNKASALLDLQASGALQVLLIKSGPDPARTAYGSPSLDVTMWDAVQLDSVLDATRTLTDWTAFFAVSADQDDEDLPPEVADPADFEGRLQLAKGAVKTPRKAPSKGRPEMSPPELVLKPVPTTPDFPKGASRSIVEALQANQEMLRSAVADLQRDLQRVSSALQDRGSSELRMADKLNVLQSLMGSPPPNPRAPTLWHSVDDLAQSLTALDSQRVDLPTLSTALRTQKEEVLSQSAKLSQQVETQLAGQLQALLLGPTGKAIQDGHLAATRDLPALAARVTQLEAAGSSMSLVGGTESPSPEELTSLREMVNQLRRQVTDLRGQGLAVTIEGEHFASLDDTLAWVKSNRVKDMAFYFMDAVSLLQVLSVEHATSTDRVDGDAKGNKVGLKDPLAREVFHSFEKELPDNLGGSKTTQSADRRSLAKLKTFKDFRGSGALDSGAKKRILNEINEAMSAITTKIVRSGMSAEAITIAKSLLRESKAFVQSLFSFMEEQYLNYGADSALTPARRWALICAVVRIVFGEIAKVRGDPKFLSSLEVHEDDTAACVVWAVFQAHRVMAEFIRDDFRNHPSIAPMLTGHLLEIVAYREQVDKVRADVTAQVTGLQQDVNKAKATAEAAKRIADQATSVANKRAKRAPGEEKE